MNRNAAAAVVAFFDLSSIAVGQFVPGDLYIGAFNTIYHVDAVTWTVSTFADGSDGLSGASSMLFTASNTLLCSNFYSTEILEFDSAGSGSVLFDGTNGLTGPGGANGLIYDTAGNLYVADGLSQARILCFPVGGGAATVFADATDGLVYPSGLAFTANGTMLVANGGATNVLSIDPAGNASVFDVLPDEPDSIVVRSNSDVYVGTNYPPPNSGISIYRYPGGDVTQRVLFFDSKTRVGPAVLQLSLDQHTLYLATGGLTTIDADSGVATDVFKHGLNNPLSIAIYGANLHASWSNYGVGFSGTNGVPALTSRVNPILGTTVTIDLENSYAQPTIGLLFVGFQQTFMHSSWGGDLLVVPIFTLPMTFSFGSNSFAGDLPNDPRLAGTKLELQAIEADPGAAKGVSFTQGLELVLGY